MQTAAVYGDETTAAAAAERGMLRHQLASFLSILFSTANTHSSLPLVSLKSTDRPAFMWLRG